MSTPVRTKPLQLNLPAQARSQPGNLHFSDALFQQALVQHDDAAWAMVQERYQSLVCTWIKAKLTTGADEARLQQLAQQAFAKLRAAFARHPQKFYDFPNRAALLGLLRLCAERVTLTGLALVLALSLMNWQQPLNSPTAGMLTARTAEPGVFYRQQIHIEAQDRTMLDLAERLQTTLAAEEQGGITCHAGIGPGRAVCTF